MALKPDRHEVITDISYYMSDTATRGLVVVHDTGGSGAAMDQAEANVILPTGGVSGSSPAGLLMNDVVNLDLTRQHLNEHKDEVQVNSKVRLLRRGWVVTNSVTGTPAIGDNAYYDTNGNLSPADTGNSPKVGKFLSTLDNDGYAKVDVNIVD